MVSAKEKPKDEALAKSAEIDKAVGELIEELKSGIIPLEKGKDDGKEVR